MAVSIRVSDLGVRPASPPGRAWTRQRAVEVIPPRGTARAAARPAAQTRPRELRNAMALLFAILLISIMSILYMTQTGKLATSGYQISNLQAQRDKLRRDNQQLQVELAQLDSLPSIEQRAAGLHMVKGELAKVKYVSLDAQQLAAIRSANGASTPTVSSPAAASPAASAPSATVSSAPAASSAAAAAASSATPLLSRAASRG